MKTLLITGHRGLLGSACIRRFQDDFQIVVSEIDWRDHTKAFSSFEQLLPNYVIHCAARVGGVLANKVKPVDFLLDNLKMQNNVIEAAAIFNVEKLIFVGTSCMFPRDAQVPVVEESLMTGRLEDSVEAYAIAKLAGWRLCKAYNEQVGKKFLTVNPSNIYGIGDNYRADSAHVIPALISRLHQSVQEKSIFTVWGDGSAVREFIYSDDVANAFEVILDKYDSPEVLSCGTGIGHTIKELVETLISIIGEPQRVVWDCGKPTGIPRKTFNVDKLKHLGWEPKVTLREGLKLAYEDFLSNPFLRK